MSKAGRQWPWRRRRVAQLLSRLRLVGPGPNSSQRSRRTATPPKTAKTPEGRRRLRWQECQRPRAGPAWTRSLAGKLEVLLDPPLSVARKGPCPQATAPRRRFNPMLPSDPDRVAATRRRSEANCPPARKPRLEQFLVAFLDWPSSKPSFCKTPAAGATHLTQRRSAGI